MNKNKTSLTYRILVKLGYNYSEEEYGNVSLLRVVGKFFSNIRKKFLSNMMDWALLEPIAPRKLRPWLIKRMGCRVGKNVFIGDFVRVDLQHAHMIYIDDYAHHPFIMSSTGFKALQERG